MKVVEVIVERTEENLSAYINNVPIIVVGNDINEIESQINDAIKLYINSCTENNLEISDVLRGDFELKFKIDVVTFLSYYSGIFTKAALSRITGINERQLWHYAAGIHKPRKQQLTKIENGIRSLTKELSSISLL